ncbi:NAD(P)/FAD-dependent oxidoreductase [Sphingomonas lacunae]|uniref:NAD(P)/FAD-dependent oxidoreductase n=1 Tax=Sphingomonas lacunae TaxID=2698828 RepID=A0A6M4AYC0_9SPHN|nr:NAD(P)/FAD-dependent oxidoreductase [Sphingomonas lacunae]QJQ31991.1 NAD(P)/FAD-dependent oxidoreductase [Sphingomonas lacunae]
MTAHSFDAIILGAGAAGLFCAAQAGQRGRRVLLVDHADEPGKKILISGGGRCNFTNINAGPANYLSANPHFAKSAFSRYTAQDFIDLVDAHGIAWHEKTLGQLFCDGSAKQIVAMLMAECAKGSVTHWFSSPVDTVSHADGHFTLCSGGRTATAPRLVLATGGLSIPKLGATGLAYDLARQFGLKVVEPRPALVPLTLGGDEVLFRELSGVAAPVEARAGSGKGRALFREAALFTHRGLSGPAILQVSSYWRKGEPIAINFLPDSTPDWLLAAKREQPRTSLRKLLGGALPSRLADALCDQLGKMLQCDIALANCTDPVLRAVTARISDWQFHPNGSEGFAKAEVTVGGISTAELSSKDMESRRVPGLHAIGEAVDVTGWLGGYNFQWAWASGWAAGQSL